MSCLVHKIVCLKAELLKSKCKHQNLQVRCLMDHGEFETQDGNILLLKKNSQVFFTTHNYHISDEITNTDLKKKTVLSTNFWSISIRNSLNKNWKLEYKFYDIFCWWLDNIIGRKCLSFVQFSLYDFKPTAEYLIPQKRLDKVIYFSAFHVEIGMWTFDSSGNTGTHCPLKLIYVIAELRKSQQYLYI